MKKYVVYGLGISGISTLKFLAKNSIEEKLEVVATDDNQASIVDAEKKIFSTSQELVQKIKFQKPEEVAYNRDTKIIFAPGIPLYFPKPHKILEIVKSSGSQLFCDLELFFLQNQNQNFLGITGTNGKSTTTALTGFVLKELGLSAEIGGNIGVPCFDLPILPSGSAHVFETSSYQLDLMNQTHFRVASLLNITPDHIDRHGSFENYVESKKKIFRNQKYEDFALIGVDNSTSAEVFESFKKDKNFAPTLVPISVERIVQGGVSLVDGKLSNKIGGADFEKRIKHEFLRGKHNDQNIAFAFANVYCYLKQQNLLGEKSLTDVHKVTQEKILEAIEKFRGLRHRLQLLGSIDGVSFVNDSKATNAESTENALKAYKNIFWILGGKAKEGGISMLQPYFKKVVKAYLIGEASEDFAKILQSNNLNLEMCGDLENAIERSFLDARKSSLEEKNILLSPACASFDQWKNFEERGDFFCKTFDRLSKF